MGVPRIDGTPTKTQKAMRTLNEDQPLSVRSSRRPVTAPTSRLSEDPILEDKEMKTTLLHVRRLAVAAALLGAIVSPRAVSAQSALDASEAGAFMGSWSSVRSNFPSWSRTRTARSRSWSDYPIPPVLVPAIRFL